MSGILHIPLSVLDAAETDADMRRLVWLFKRASWKQQVFPWRQKSGAVRQIPLGKGEVFATLRYLSEIWKDGIGAVRGFLERMAERGVIEVVTRAGVTVIRLLTLADAKGKARDNRTDRKAKIAQSTACNESKTHQGEARAEHDQSHKINLVNKSNPPTPSDDAKPGRDSWRSRRGSRKDKQSPFRRFVDAVGQKTQAASQRPVQPSAPVARSGMAEKGLGGVLSDPSTAPAKRAGLSPAQVEEARTACDPVQWQRLRLLCSQDNPHGDLDEATARRWRADAILRGVDLVT